MGGEKVKVHDSKREGDDERYTAHVMRRHETRWGVAELVLEAHGVTDTLARQRLRALEKIMLRRLNDLKPEAAQA